MKTFKEAKRLSDVKWTYIYNNNGKIDGLFEAHPELSKLLCSCGFCERHSNFDNFGVDCRKCPIKVKEQSCLDIKHPFSEWQWNPNKKNALAVLKLVREAKERK